MERPLTSIEPATEGLLTAFYGRPPPRTVRALVAVRDGKPIGVAGVWRGAERLVMFSDLSPEARADKRLMVRGIRAVLGLVRDTGLPVHAVADKEVEGSERLLERVGFHRLTDEVWECRDFSTGRRRS